LGEAEKTHGTEGNVIFYLAVADRFFGPVMEQLGKAKLTNQDEDKKGKHQFWRRVVIEKPFGHSLDSARELNARILRTLHEDQIFRIDPFLGKDTVQSIMAFRFANGLFEPIWNRDRIDHAQISVAETVGVERRGKFYEGTGALRDMVPNHVFTLLSMVAMEPPTGFDAASIRTKKAEVFAAMPAVKPARAVRGQYGAGTVLGKQVNAYRKEPNVAADSNIETYVAMQLEIDNWRWAGVPFYLRTGKHMSQRNTEIAIRFAGIVLAITSGRPPRGMSMLIAPLALKGAIAGFNGGVFVHPDLSVIERHTLDPATAKETVKLILGQGLDAWVYTEEEWLIRDKEAPHVARETWTVKFDANVVASFTDSHLAHAVKIVGVSDDVDLVAACENLAQNTLGEKASAARSQPYYLDVTNPQANKGTVVATLSKLLNIPPAQIATIGDMPNDVLMFRKSGFSIAMGNSSDEVKAQASAVTGSNENEGFAKAVRKFILRPAGA
jgi:Cof subfamily protein (haloacid dehalogenase superfamily)